MKYIIAGFATFSIIILALSFIRVVHLVCGKISAISCMLSMLALFCFWSLPSKADSIYAGAVSYHIDPSPLVNNSVHNLVAYERNGYIVGYFKNSFSEDTGFIAKRYELFNKGNFKAGVYVGLDYGYNGCDQKKDTGKNSVCILVVPELAYTKYKTQAVISLLGNAIAIGPKWEF